MIIQLSPVEMQMAKAIGNMRKTASKGGKTRTMVSDNDYLGSCGEIAFADFMNVPYDWRNKVTGDGGVDFTLNGVTIDVKCTRGTLSHRLMVHEGKVFADVYVLMLMSRETEGEITLAGWEYGENIKAILPRKPPFLKGKPEEFVVMTHIVETENLRLMSELKYAVLYERKPDPETNPAGL